MFWRLALRGVSVAAALSVAVACAKGEDGIELGAGGSSDPDAGADAARVPSTDGGKADAANKTDDDSGSGPGCTGKLVINELMTRGSEATEEFVELYNPNSCAVPLGGWKIAYRSKTGGTTASTLHAFATGDEIPAESFLVIGTAKFAGKKDATMNGGMADEGQVGLVDDTDTLVDGLGYGGATGEFVEGTAAAGPPANGSVGRKSDGLDTDNNASDCKAFSQHTAGAAN